MSAVLYWNCDGEAVPSIQQIDSKSLQYKGHEKED